MKRTRFQGARPQAMMRMTSRSPAINESVLCCRIHMLETALRGKNQEVQICSKLENILETRRDKIQARGLKRMAQRHLRMLSKIYQFYKGDAVQLLSEKTFQIITPVEGAAAVLKNRQEMSSVYAALHNVPNARIRRCMRSIQEDESKNLQWYQQIADSRRNETVLCGGTEERLILMGIGSREEYIQMLNYGKNSVHTVCPSCFETDAHGNLLILPLWKANLGYLVNEAHRREIQVIPLLKVRIDDIAFLNTLSTRLAYFIKQYHLDGINIDVSELPTRDITALAEFMQLIRKKAGCSKTVAVTGKICGPMSDFSGLSHFVDYFVILPGMTSIPAADFFLNLKIPKNKIVIGFSLCGRYSKMGDSASDMDLAAEDIEALLQQYTAAIRFDPIMMQMNATVIIREWDPPLQICNSTALTPGVYDVWYDTPETVQCKMEFAQQEKLLGTAVWCVEGKW